MPKRVTIIGAGPGGYVAAVRLAQLGAEVTVVEKDNVGGTCLNRGCIPSKVMKSAVETLDRFRRAPEYGLRVDGPVRIDLKQLMTRKNMIVENLGQEIKALLHQKKIHYLPGIGRINGSGQVLVDQADGSRRIIDWDGLLLAVGSKPGSIPPLPIDGEKIISSDHIFSLTQVPGSIAVVGGGVIGCELAFILAGLGARVTVVEALSRLLPLPSVDEDCSKVIGREMKKIPIRFLVNKTVEKVDLVDDKIRLTAGPSPFSRNLKKKDLIPEVIEVEKVLICVGRKANTDGLGLETIGVRQDGQGWIPVDEHMATNHPLVYALGDTLGPSKIMLAHVAVMEGLTAAENILGGKQVMDYSCVPGAIFTMPEVANVGVTEEQAKSLGLNYRADEVNFRNLGKAQVISEIAGLLKIISDRESGRVLGVHIVGPHATDLIAEGTLAVKQGLTIRDLAETIHAHPTLAEIVWETANKALDLPIHG